MPDKGKVQQPDPSPKLQDILYISSHATSEMDILESLLTLVFGRYITSTIWGDINDLPTDIPCCVIMSPPFGRTQSPTDPETEDFWNKVRALYPRTPIIWLVPSDEAPYFVRPKKGFVHIMETQYTENNVAGDFIDAIAEVTGIQPTTTFLYSKE